MAKDDCLLNLAMKKAQEGAIFILLDDIRFVTQVYKSNKSMRDYVTYKMYLANPETVYIYTIPDRNNLGIHSKVVNAFYLSNQENQYCLSSIGSFNPSYPESMTLEIVFFLLYKTKLCKD